MPYKGSGPVVADVLGGQVPLGIVDLPSAMANVKAGKLKAIAVTTLNRIDAAPEVPTFAEAGMPGYESIGWFGAVASREQMADAAYTGWRVDMLAGKVTLMAAATNASQIGRAWDLWKMKVEGKL